LFPPRHIWNPCKAPSYGRIFAIAALIIALSGASNPALAAPPGAIVSNQATLDYVNLAGGVTSVPSNPVDVTVAVVRSPSSIEFTRVLLAGAGSYQESVGPAYCSQGGSFVLLPDPVITGGVSIDATAAQEVIASPAYNLGEPLFVRLVDSDQNLDYQVIDTAVVDAVHPSSGDIETIRLTETGPDTGVFTGYVPSARGPTTAGDCVLQGAMDTDVRVDYTDPADGTDSTQASAELDPVSVVFESRTGTLVDAVQIALVDAASGAPATVYGNDGVSVFPSVIASGTTVTDASGASYAFGPGEYRFPVVADGNYRLVVTPPPEYAAPSTTDIADLQQLPGAPYDLGPASYGNAFVTNTAPSFNWDIPVDPQATALFLEKRTQTTIAAPGDFVRYELALENSSSSGMATDIELIDQLPLGVRFVPGSVVVDGAAAPDPEISADASVLEFGFASLDIGERLAISYVVEIIGGERDDELVNRATAFASGGLISNEATALIRLTEDLFRNSGTIIGRVLEGDCNQETFSEDQGVAGIRVYLEDGRYAVSDDGGRFHFEGVVPGTHIAQIDTFTVPAYFDVIGCADNPQFGSSADSQFVKLSRGALLRADFYLRRKKPPEGRIELELRSSSADSPDEVSYTLTLNGIGNVRISNISAAVLLPNGVEYAPGTMRIDGQGLGDPRVLNGTLSLALPERTGNWTSTIAFRASFDDKTNGELSTKAVATFDTPMAERQKTPLAETRMHREPATVQNAGYVLDLKFDILSAELSDSDKDRLAALIADWRGVRNIRISAVGHSDSTPIRLSKQHLFADNYVLSRARANAAVSYIAGALGIPHDYLQVEGRGPDDPVADNKTVEGRSRNRRVELIMSGVRPSRPSFLEVTKAESGAQVVDTVGAIPGEDSGRRRTFDQASEVAGMPGSQIEPALESLAPGTGFILPARDFSPAIPATKVSVKHRPDQTVELTVNDQPVSPLNFDAVVVNRSETVAVSRWRTVALQDGPNDIHASVVNADGSVAKRLKRSIHFSGAPVRAEIVPELSKLSADGKTPPLVAIRLFDRAGRTARPGMIGGFDVSPPYRSLWEVETSRENRLVNLDPREASYRIGEGGIAYIELAPTTRSGELTINLAFENFREQELRTWLKAAKRDWILVGFAEGTGGYSTISDNAVGAAENGYEDGYYDEGRVAFFAKGQIKGEFLLTLAYDSDRDRDRTANRFQTAIDPNEYYPLYADTSEQRFEAPSQRKLYVKLERNQFYALFGDTDTGLSVTDLARYERRFNGLKSEYRGQNVGYTVFAAETSEAFNRDEIRGDGTSGLYHLSAAPVIINSEKVTIETRDRFDSGQVLGSRALTRFLDYNLDPLNGTLYFKRPVPSRDLEFNPVYIVVEYETRTDGAEDLLIGGRGSVRSDDGAVEFGVTHINDDTVGAEADLTGADFRWQINDETLLKAEYAESNSTDTGNAVSGSASMIEFEHNGARTDVRAYIREVEEDFGLGYQNSADSGFRRLAVDARTEVGESIFLEGEAAWQQALVTEDIRNLVRGRLRYERDSFTGSVGLTHAADKFDDGDTRQSDLAEITLAKRIFDDRLNLRLSGSTELSGDAESLDYPTRIVVGADYRVSKGVELLTEYEDARGRDIDATMTRVGVRTTPWARAQIDTSLTNQTTEFGPRLFANVGLVQGFQLNERWSLDVGLDQTETILQPEARPFDADRELVSGSFNEDFVAVYTGALYNADLWSANARLEYRDADSEQRMAILFGWYREPSIGHGLSAGMLAYRSESPDGTEMTAADMRFGWAYRFADGKWSFLNRVDLVYEDTVLTTDDLRTWRVINNFNANRRFSGRTQMSLQYAFKYVRSEFDSIAYTGYTDLVGFDIRRGMRGRFDLGVNTSVYHSWESDVVDYGFGVDIGYNFASNVWITLGYNVAGFHDEDFTEARYTAQGPFLRFSMKADQHALKRIAGRE
jgi:uncharacterized repeat protein (TIGR01451 family)